MPANKSFEEQKAERLRELNETLLGLESQDARLNKERETIDKEKARVQSEQSRIKDTFLNGDFCPECLLHDGVQRKYSHVRIDYPYPGYETHRCGACGYEDIRKQGLL